MNIKELKQKIKLALTENPDKKITPAELEEALLSMADSIGKHPEQGSTIKNELFYDDGSGEVVPVKHPDLSTQPSILPYKFAGNYVYEQMVWLNSSDIEAGMKKVDIPEGIKPESLMVIDITGCAQSSQGCETADVGAAATAEGLFIGVASAISGAKGIWAKIQYCVSPNIGNNYYYYYHQSYIQEEDYIRFLNSLQYAFIVKFNYITATGTSSSALTVHSGGEVVLESGQLDDFKNNKMYITLERKDSGAPNHVTLSDGNRKHLWYLGQPLFYSYCSIAGGLTLTQLFDNVERCLITMKKE